jgi:AraC-like DNA-binding protein
MRRRVPLCRARQLLPFIEFLDRVGAPTETALQQHRLPSELRECPDMLLSAYATFGFVADLAQLEGIDCFGWRAVSPELTQLSPILVNEFHRSSTLLQALKTACVRAHRESSNVALWLEERGDSLFVCHRGSIQVGALGSDDANIMRTAFLISVVRLFMGRDWFPTEIGFALASDITQVLREHLPGVELQRTADWGWLRLPRKILPEAPLRLAANETRSGVGGGDEPEMDLAGSLAQALRPYLSRGAPPLIQAADLAGLSIRSLQRELASEGASYREVLQRAKLAVARDLLDQPGVKISDVALATGFRNPPHFTRFFRRLAGVTPVEYHAARAEN